MATDERHSEALIDLEVRVAFQGKTIAELDAVVRSLFSRIDTLERQLSELRAAGDGETPLGPANEPPPHY